MSKFQLYSVKVNELYVIFRASNLSDRFYVVHDIDCPELKHLSIFFACNSTLDISMFSRFLNLVFIKLCEEKIRSTFGELCGRRSAAFANFEIFPNKAEFLLFFRFDT